MNDFQKPDYKGLYICRIEDQGLTQNSKGTPQVKLRFQILAKCNTDGTREVIPDNQFSSCWMPLTAKAVGWVSGALTQIGFTGPPSGIDLESPNCCDLRGKEAEFFAQVQDDGFIRWSINTPRGSKAPAKLDDTRRMELDAMFGDSFKKSDAATTTTTPVGGSTFSVDDNAF